ncbi:oocyte-expressed protein homolog [Ctenodactylus gundi]
MVDPRDVEEDAHGGKVPHSPAGLPPFPLTPLRIRVRPWWFPGQELREPLVFYLEAPLADAIFGPDRAIIPEMEWVSQALLSVNKVEAADLVEITVFGRPRVQSRVKRIILSLASWQREFGFYRDFWMNGESPNRDWCSGTPQSGSPDPAQYPPCLHQDPGGFGN